MSQPPLAFSAFFSVPDPFLNNLDAENGPVTTSVPKGQELLR